MTVLDLIVMVTTILFFVRWKTSKEDFDAYLFDEVYVKGIIKFFYIVLSTSYIILNLIIRINFDFLFYKIF
jgi:hypothetical protein